MFSGTEATDCVASTISRVQNTSALPMSLDFLPLKKSKLSHNWGDRIASFPTEKSIDSELSCRKDDDRVTSMAGSSRLRLPPIPSSPESLKLILRQFTTSRRCDCHKRIDELEKSIENWKTKANQLEALLDRTILFHSDDNSAMKFSDSTKKTNTTKSVRVQVNEGDISAAERIISNVGSKFCQPVPTFIPLLSTETIRLSGETGNKQLCKDFGSILDNRATACSASFQQQKVGRWLGNQQDETAVVDLTNDIEEESVDNVDPKHSSLSGMTAQPVTGFQHESSPKNHTKINREMPALLCAKPFENGIHCQQETLHLSRKKSGSDVIGKSDTFRRKVPLPPLYHSGGVTTAQLGMGDSSVEMTSDDIPTPVLSAKLEGKGVVVSWNMASPPQSIHKYELFSKEHISNEWQLVGLINPMPLPMACTLTQFQKGCQYTFRVRAVDNRKKVSQFSNESHLRL